MFDLVAEYLPKLDTNFMLRYVPQFVKAAQLTALLGLLGVLGSVGVGALCSLVRYYKTPVLSQIVGLYIELSRNTPLLIQLFFLYFGLPQIGIRLDSVTCAIIGLVFLGGSYMAEAFRGGLESVSKIQVESGLSIGLSAPQLVRYVILPQAFAVAVPAIGANAIFLLKETSVFSVIALADLTYVAKDIMGSYYKTSEAMVMLVISYLVLLLPLSILFSFIEKRVRHAGSGT